MTDPRSAAKARLFHEMHLGPEILVIANAWDAGSARVFEDAGIRAIGTGSAGVAFSHGFVDDERIPREVMLRAIEEMVAAVDVPVTADILAGLGDSIEAVVATVQEVIALGAAGVNIEDSSEVGGAHLLDADYQAEKIAAVCAAVEASGVPIVVNARTDAYWLKLGHASERLRTSIERARRYREAGAHCVFVPGTVDRVTLKTLVAEIDAPLNVLATPGCPAVAELQEIGVARLSEGSGPMRAGLMLARQIARDLLDHGTYARFHDDAIPYDEANGLFRDRAGARR